jgi:uncharacterized protein YjbI with pentapeptide repeats
LKEKSPHPTQDAALGLCYRNWGGVLTGADLTGAKLSGADLSSAYLNHAKLLGADLSKADLREAKLDGQPQLDLACGTEPQLPPGLTLKPCPEPPPPARP